MSTTWKFDADHSEIEFKVKHMMISNVKGSFDKFDVSLTSEDESFKDAVVKATIDASSIDTKNEQRDQHLKSPDFFNTEEFPEITFVSTSYDGEQITGELTIRDVTKTVSFDVEFGGVSKDPWGNLKAGFSAEGKIKRSDFGLNWNQALETGGVLVSDDVRFSINIQLIKG